MRLTTLGLAGAKLAPAYAGAAFSLNEMVALLTAAYTGLMLARDAWRWRQEWKAKREAERPIERRTAGDE